MSSRIRILIAIGCVAVAVASAGPGDEGGAATRAAARRRVSESIRRLRRAGMAAPVSASAPADLREAIEKIRRLQVGGRSVPRQTAVPAPTQTQPVRDETPAHAAKPAALSDDVLARLEKLSVNDTIDPVGLADAVLRAGFRDSAYVLYENILRSAGPETPKDWVLLQMANCARSRDPKTARRLYARLLAEYPESPWCPVAKVQHDLIEWFEANNPGALLTAATQPAGT